MSVQDELNQALTDLGEKLARVKTHHLEQMMEVSRLKGQKLRLRRALENIINEIKDDDGQTIFLKRAIAQGKKVFEDTFK